MCEGNLDERFLKLSRLRKGVFMDTLGQMYARDICVVYMCVLRLPLDICFSFP